MASQDPFSGIDGGRPFQVGTLDSPSDPFSGIDFLSGPEPNRGFFSTLLHETARDVEGGFNVLSATGGEALRLLGLSVPIGFEDLTQRDRTGALMLAALGAGGVAGGAVRGAGLFSRLGTGALGRAATTASTEAVAGAAFGLIRPISEEEDRLRAIVGDAAFFAGIGAGASFAKTALKATFEGTLGGIRDQLARANLAKSAQMLEAETLAREVGGIRLFNPTEETEAIIRRADQNKVELVLGHPEKGPTTRELGSFNSALAEALKNGFTENLGPARRSLTRSSEDFIDAAVLRKIEESEGRIFDALENIRLGEYQAVREFARISKESKRSFDSLAAEIVAPSEGLVPVKLSNTERRLLRQELTLPKQRIQGMSDADLLREGVKQGLVTAETLEAGVARRELVRELTLNDLIPESFADLRVVSRNKDSFLTSVMTPRFIAKLHPEIEPLYRSANSRLHTLEERLGTMTGRLVNLQESVSREAAERGVQIIDASARAGSTQTAVFRAKADARRTGNEEIVRFVDEVTDILGGYLEDLQQIGKLDSGLAGYFPIFNAGQWRLELRSLKGGAEVGDFKGFHNTRKEALEEAARLSKVNPEAQFSITPKTYWYEESSVAGMNPKQFRQLQKAIQSVADEEVTASKAKEIAQEFARVQAGESPRKGSGFLKERVLGIRDFAEDPFTALETYINSIERVIAFESEPASALAKMKGETPELIRRSFSVEADRLHSLIPESKSNLKRWVEQYRDDLLGRPRKEELAVQAIVERLGIDQPRALKKYTATMRKWLGWSKLGGFGSAMLNMTQIPVNTVPVIGARWTLKGMEVLQSPKKYRNALKTLKNNGVDLEMFVPLTREGEVTTYGALSTSKTERFKDSIYRIGLFAFNGVEKMNRVVTAWGAFHREIAKGADRSTAARVAEEVLSRTQFVYRTSNMPEVLRSPIGGTVLQFKSFVINELEFIASLSKEEAARFGAMLWGVGGMSLLLNMPGSDVVDSASTLFFDEKLSEAIRVRGEGADTLPRTILFGLPGIFDVDMSDRVGVGTVRDITDGLFGPAVSDTQSFFRFLKDAVVDIGATGSVTQGTKASFVQSVMPTAIRRALRAGDIVDTGEVRDPYSGKLIYKPADRYDTALREFIGLPTLEMQKERAADRIVERARERYIRARTSFAKDAARAANEGRSEEIQSVIAEARRSGYELDNRTIRYWQRELRKPGAERRRRRTPKQLREDMEELFEATGTIDQSLLP